MRWGSELVASVNRTVSRRCVRTVSRQASHALSHQRSTTTTRWVPHVRPPSQRLRTHRHRNPRSTVVLAVRNPLRKPYQKHSSPCSDQVRRPRCEIRKRRLRRSRSSHSWSRVSIVHTTLQQGDIDTADRSIRGNEGKGTAVAVPDTDPSNRCICLGIDRNGSISAGSRA